MDFIQRNAIIALSCKIQVSEQESQFESFNSSSANTNSFYKQAGLKLLQLAVLNARSIKNKTLQIKDYIVDNDIDIMALTATWLKGHENCEFATRDVCPS
ncbi:Hypothetical predicted protein, partial [Paramuricea clavata]